MVSAPRLTVRVAASQEGLLAAAEAFDRFETAHSLDPEATWPVHVALDEILSNIVRHGSTGRAEVHIDVTATLAAGCVEVTVEDDGPAMDPLSLPEPDTTAPLEARRPGGLGVHLVRNLMDRVAYTRDGGRNRIVFSRQLSPAPRGEPPKE
jgi:anti-sigma regulatory factor (Ser/Thr protein kinase)